MSNKLDLNPITHKLDLVGSSGGGGGTPGGTNGQIQFNDNGAFGGFGSWDKTTKQLTIDGALAIKSLKGAAAKATTDPDFTFVIFPDTQFMTDTYNELWQGMVDYVLASQNSLNIQAVIGVGDVSNTANDTAYQLASFNYGRIISAGIPTIVSVGNHDYDNQATRDTTTFDTYFNSTFYSAAIPYWEYGYKDESSTKNMCTKFTVGSRIFLIISLETYPEASVLTWAQSVIDTQTTCTDVIITTHAFLNPAGLRITNTDDRGPAHYGLPNPLSGVAMWETFIKSNEKIRLVVNGHYSLGDNLSYLTSVGDNGNIIHQLFIDYQDFNFGDGIIGLLKFSPINGTIKFSAYSTNTFSTDADYGEITLSDLPPKVKTGLGVQDEVAARGDISSGGQILAGQKVRLGSRFAEQKNTSVVDITVDSDGDAVIDAPDDANTVYGKWHGSGEHIFGNGNGGLGNNTQHNSTSTYRDEALEHYNSFVRPRTPQESGTIYHPDIDPPTFGSGDGYDDIAPPGIWDSCSNAGVIEYSVEAGCGGSYAGSSTIYYRAFSYIDIPGVGRYFSSTYTEFTAYDCSDFNVRFRIHGIPVGANGIEIWKSNDNCSFYYYGDIESCFIDPCSGVYEFVDPVDSTLNLCGSYPSNFLPYGGGCSGGNITLTDYAGCYGGGNWTFHAYSYQTIEGTRYYSSTYSTATIAISLGDCEIVLNSMPGDAEGVRLIFEYPGCAGLYYYYDFSASDPCLIGQSFFVSSLSWGTNGILPESPLLPTTTGCGCADNIPINSIYRSAITNKLRYKDNSGNTFDITMTAI